MWWTKILSWGAGHWLPLAAFFVLVALLMGAYGLGRDHGSAAVKARWDAQKVLDAQALAEAGKRVAAVIERQARDYVEAQNGYVEAEARNASFARDLDAARERMRYYARRASAVPTAAACPAPTDGPARPTFDAGRAAEALADFAAEWGRIRDREANQLAGIQRLSEVQ